MGLGRRQALGAPAHPLADQLTLKFGTPVGLTMQLRDEGGRVTGTGTVTNSTCLSTLVINGSVSGLRVDLTGKDEGRGGSVAFGGSTETGGSILRLESSVLEGSCPGSGSVVLNRIAK